MSGGGFGVGRGDHDRWTKIKANASMDQNRSYSGLVKDILREAEETDRREDELYGEARGDELPESLRNPETRRQALADAKRRLAERKQRPAGEEAKPEPEELEMEIWRLRSWAVRCCGAAVGSSGSGSRGASWKPTAHAKQRPSRVIAMTG